ncbi:MAG TPA: CBS domain-containing protein [Candidatus Acidoferrales bacterium]|nr:CBS domain-containing protein [Candidatus Acidoferrales bacterium]
MTVQLMSPPVTVREDSYITHVRQLMRDGYRSLPVVDSQNRVQGVIILTDVIKVTSTKSDVTVVGFVRETGLATADFTPLDAAKIFAKTGFDVPVVRSPEDHTIIGVIDSERLLSALRFDQDTTVDTVMTTDVKTCDASDPVSKVWLNMAQYGLSCYPVMKKRRLIGVITLKDILKAGHVRLEREDDRGGRRIRSPAVEKVMKTPVITVQPDSTVWEAVNLMKQYAIGRLPVVRDSKLIGIVDRQDLVRAIV